jgi:chromosomal replication initiation ATPase DnaA
MLVVPTVVALYNAHKARLARINAAAIPQTIFPVSEVEVDKARLASEAEAKAKAKARIESERVRKERIKATWAKKTDAARGPIGKERAPPFFNELLNEVCRFYGVTSLAVKSARRDAGTVLPRQVLCYLAYSETALSFPAIGRLIGNRDHTTILYAARKIEFLLKEETDEDLTVAIITIKLRLQDRVQARHNIFAATA